MMEKRQFLYILAWLAYAVFCFALFPQLKITVMLFSIPLAMLGGWVYAFKGALFTTLLTIPLHYLLLNYYSDTRLVVLEALNPFGISSQLAFSFSTALLKATKQRYEHLNKSLETMVEERTRSLELLAGHLVESKDSEADTAEAALINEPLRHLEDILKTGRQLYHKLAETGHPASETAEAITTLVTASIEQLQELGQRSQQRAAIPKRDYSSINQLTDDFAHLADGKTKINIEGNWGALSSDISHGLCPIIHEALANAFRHANPSLITVTVRFDAGTIVASVENDGKPLPLGIHEGMGLPLMRYHARRMGSTLTVQTCKSNQNTQVECVIPVRSQ